MKSGVDLKRDPAESATEMLKKNSNKVVVT